MSRRRDVPKRKILPDPKYQDKLVTKFMNGLMTRGKKSTAEAILYGSFDVIERRTGHRVATGRCGPRFFSPRRHGGWDDRARGTGGDAPQRKRTRQAGSRSGKRRCRMFCKNGTNLSGLKFVSQNTMTFLATRR
jgi:hypothetical protein